MRGKFHSNHVAAIFGCFAQVVQLVKDHTAVVASLLWIHSLKSSLVVPVRESILGYLLEGSINSPQVAGVSSQILEMNG